MLPSPRDSLISIYSDVLINLKRRIPETSIYRQSTTALYEQRLKIVQEEINVDQIELKTNGGQVEELLKQGKDELKLVLMMAELKAYEGIPEPTVPGQWTDYFTSK